jgi:hypothetical protein
MKTLRKTMVVLLVGCMLMAYGSISFAKTTTEMTRDAANAKIPCFSPRGELSLSASTTDITPYLAIRFPADDTVTITWQDDTTTSADVVAGEIWAIDKEYIKSIATSSAAVALWM